MRVVDRICNQEYERFLNRIITHFFIRRLENNRSWTFKSRRKPETHCLRVVIGSDDLRSPFETFAPRLFYGSKLPNFQEKDWYSQLPVHIFGCRYGLVWRFPFYHFTPLYTVPKRGSPSDTRAVLIEEYLGMIIMLKAPHHYIGVGYGATSSYQAVIGEALIHSSKFATGVCLTKFQL